ILGLVATPPGEITSGTIHYRGENLITTSLGDLQQLRGNRISYVFQNPLTSLNPLLTVGGQLAETIRRHQSLSSTEIREKVIQLLRQVQIPNAEERATAYPHELSGGMRQRVVIAMALANDPEIIIADEPTTALDVTIQAQVLGLIKQLQQKSGLSLLFISHDFGVVSEICDRVMVMYAGRVVETGPTDAVITHPLHPYTQKLVACVPKLGESGRNIQAIPGMAPAVNNLPEGCAFAKRCDMAAPVCREQHILLKSVDTDRAIRCIRFSMGEL
ncbi:MAG: ABC transporter ATP-binding protein, partial [Desulfotignum balticum]|nr:ABC transporter ATP-binding protein [Desulfotignum balticum]